MIHLTPKHLKTTTWCGPQGADSHSQSRPERPGTKTSWYFCIKNVVQRYKNYHIDRKYSFPCLFIVITTTALIVTAEMFNFNVHVDRIWLHCSGSFRIVPDFSTSPLNPMYCECTALCWWVTKRAPACHNHAHWLPFPPLSQSNSPYVRGNIATQQTKWRTKKGNEIFNVWTIFDEISVFYQNLT